MRTKFTQSWRLFKASMGATLTHRKLLWFPVLSTLLTSMIALFFLAPLVLPVVLHPTGYRLSQKEHWVALRNYYLPADDAKPNPNTPASNSGFIRQTVDLLSKGASAEKSGHPDVAATAPSGDHSGKRTPAHISPLVPIYFTLLYFVSMFLATFFNVAFYNEIISALNGGDVSFRRGLGVARSRWPSILAWSLLAGLVGWLIHKLQERLPFVGRLIIGLVGIAWSVAAVFVIPVIIQQPMRNPVRILKQSALTLKKAWGEGLIGYIGFSAGSLLLLLASLLVLGLGVVLGLAAKSAAIIILTVAFWLIGMVCLGYISSVAGHVYKCALYIYAAEGVVPEPYEKDLLDMAWKVKSN